MWSALIFAAGASVGSGSAAAAAALSIVRRCLRCPWLRTQLNGFELLFHVPTVIRELHALIYLMTLVHKAMLMNGSQSHKSLYKNNRHTIVRVCLGITCHHG